MFDAIALSVIWFIAAGIAVLSGHPGDTVPILFMIYGAAILMSRAKR